MKKIVVSLVTGAAFFALATPAAAAVKSGGRIEAVAGWDHASVDLGDLGIDGDLDRDGIVFGLGAGYDFAASENVSVGLDIEGTLSTADIDIVDGTDRAEISIGRDLYAGGRVTFAVSPTVNAYVKAGYTNARVEATLTSPTGNLEDSANADGIRGGLGMQLDLGTSAYVGGEYRYSNYEAGFERHQAVLTLGFRM